MRRLKKLGIFLLVLLIAAAVGVFTVYRIGQSKLASRGGGAIPTADELVYADLTDDENAAILYRAAWNTLEDTPEGTSDDAQMLISEYTKTILGRIVINEEPHVATESPSRSQRAISPQALQRQRERERENSEDALSDEDIQFVGVLLAEADPAFEILRQVRDTKGALFLNDHSPGLALQNQKEMDEVGKWMRGLARYVAARALWESEQGNTEAALEWVTTGLHMANDLSHESVLIGELVKVAIAEMMLSAAQGILHEYPVSEPIPKALLDELDDLRDRTHYGDSLRREAVFSEALAQAQGRGWFLMGILQGNYLDSLGVFIEAVKVDDYTERTRLLDELSDDVKQSNSGFTKFLHIFEGMILPALIRSDEALERLIAKCDLLELTLALRTYEQTHGVFPETLADLVPEFLTALPEDPLNGKQYLYEKSAERITVRSEETNRRGGEIAFHLAPLAQVSGTPEGQ